LKRMNKIINGIDEIVHVFNIKVLRVSSRHQMMMISAQR